MPLILSQVMAEQVFLLQLRELLWLAEVVVGLVLLVQPQEVQAVQVGVEMVHQIARPMVLLERLIQAEAEVGAIPQGHLMLVVLAL
jgi:hypothetical protein